LDGLPLAIAQAGAFLQESGTGIKAYLGFYERQWSDLMESTHSTDALLQDYPERSVWMTWAISYQAIYEKHEHTAKLLLLWSFLDNKNLWYGLFREACSFSEVGKTILSRWIGKIATSELAFSQAMQLLRNYSLVEEVKETTGYATHPVVHQWAYHYQGKQFKLELNQLAVIVVGFAVPKKARPDYSTLQQQLIPHAYACSKWILKEEEEQGNETTEEYKQSERSGKGLEGTEEREALFDAIGCLGILYADQSKLVEAEQISKQALQGYKTFGLTHPSRLDTINNLGVLYKEQGRLVEAEQMYKQALQGYIEALGPTHLLRLDTINNLGVLYKEQGRLVESEQMYNEALQGYTEALGPTHPSRLDIINNLGILYREQGRFVESEQMYKQALQGYAEAFGPTHPSRLDTINNLGVLYREQGKLAEAEQMFKQALQGYTEALGPTHPETLGGMYNLAILYGEQGKLAEAEQMYTQALYAYKKTLGDTQVRTYRPALYTIYNMGLLYAKQEDYARAQEMFTDALSGYQAIFGPSHHECLEISAFIDECSAHLQAKNGDNKKGKKGLRTRFRRLADKLR
jgi:tetratricopeptide (TPR) repeat protein